MAGRFAAADEFTLAVGPWNLHEKLADQPRPEGASALAGSGFFRLPVGDWRVFYFPDDDTSTLHIEKVGRVPAT